MFIRPELSSIANSGVATNLYFNSSSTLLHSLTQIYSPPFHVKLVNGHASLAKSYANFL